MNVLFLLLFACLAFIAEKEMSDAFICDAALIKTLHPVLTVAVALSIEHYRG